MNIGIGRVRWKRSWTVGTVMCNGGRSGTKENGKERSGTEKNGMLHVRVVTGR